LTTNHFSGKFLSKFCSPDYAGSNDTGLMLASSPREVVKTFGRLFHFFNYFYDRLLPFFERQFQTILNQVVRAEAISAMKAIGGIMALVMNIITMRAIVMVILLLLVSYLLLIQ
jgi:hypothetical protein